MSQQQQQQLADKQQQLYTNESGLTLIQYFVVIFVGLWRLRGRCMRGNQQQLCRALLSPLAVSTDMWCCCAPTVAC